MSDWTSQRLGEYHGLAQLDCGRDELDRWLLHEALRAQAAGIAHTTVWTRPEDLAVVAYYAIAPTQFMRIDLPSRSLSTCYSTIPGYLIARLALNQGLHGQGLGTQLLLDALKRIVAAATNAGGRLIAVDALDDAAHRFYRHHDFQPILGTPANHKDRNRSRSHRALSTPHFLSQRLERKYELIEGLRASLVSICVSGLLSPGRVG